MSAVMGGKQFDLSLPAKALAPDNGNAADGNADLIEEPDEDGPAP